MQDHFKRREILSATTLLALLPTGAFAKKVPLGTADAPQALADKPYERISPMVSTDSNRVRLLFTYDCPYCRSYHNGLVQWGATLPAPLRFEATPVITSNTDNLIMAVYGRLLMQGVAPTKTHLYDYSMYTQIQGDSDSGQVAKGQLSADDVLRTVSNAAGVQRSVLREYLTKHGGVIEKRLPEHAALIQTYGLKVTPAVAIAGKILVNPDHAGGNPQQFLLLLNAMVSRSIQGGLDAI